MSLTWTKLFSASDDGSILTGSQVGTIQNDISTQVLINPNAVANSVSGASFYSLTSTPSGAGILPLANTYEGPAFSVHKNGTNQTGIVSGAATLVTWSTKAYDTNSNFASNVFTPTVAGKYHLKATVYFTVGVDQTVYNILLRKTGAGIAFDQRNCSGTSSLSLSVNMDVTANGSTDYFDVYVTQVSGGDKIIDGTSYLSYFQGFFIGA